MENFFRKYGWTIRLAAIVIVCLLLALSVNGFISSALAPYTVPQIPDLYEQAKRDSATDTPSKPGTAQNWTRTLSERCYFGCPEEPDTAPTCPAEGCPEGQQCVGGQCVEAQPIVQNPGAGTLPVQSDLTLKLTGVMVSNKPRWSTAILTDEASKQGYFVRPGDSVLGQATLLEVRRDRVILDRNGRLEYIRLVDSIAGNPSAASQTFSSGLPSNIAPSPSSLPSTAEPISAEKLQQETEQAQNAPGNGVQRIDNNAYSVDRKSMNAKLEDRASLAKGATIVPNYKAGKKSGLKLVNIQGGSVYEQLGMKSGDVLMSVNGQDIRSQTHAMELMDRFREADSVTIAVERNGKQEKIKYDIK